MDENKTPPSAAENAAPEGAPAAAPAAAAPAPWKTKARKWLTIGGIGVLIVPIVAFVAWTAITLNYSYSNGHRAGFVQKISKKGWICPTWEGELQLVNIPGAAPERWSFSVRDDIVAAAVQSSIGNRVALEYEEHRGVPTSCFGETSYFVVGVRKVAEP